MADKDIYGPCKDGNTIEFFMKEVKDEAGSAAKGYPEYTMQHWIRIIQPGSRDQPEFLMDDIRIERYREEYEAWKRRLATGETGSIGTPLTQWPTIDRAMAAGLRDMGIYNVEMLANILDSNISKFPPNMRTLRDQARAFLEAAKSNAPLTKMAKQIEDLQAQLAARDQQIADILSVMQEKGVDPGTAQAAAPAIDMQRAIDAAVKKALASVPGVKAKGKPRGRPFAKKQSAGVAASA